MTSAGAEPKPPGLYEADIVAYPPRARVVVGLLTVFARGSVLGILAALLYSSDPPDNPLRQMRLFTALFLAPELAAWLLARAHRTHIRVADGLLVLTSAQERIEVPLESIVRVTPWRLPLPRGGVYLWLRSGARLERAMQALDPVSLVDAMVAGGAPAEIRADLDSPSIVYARARLAHPPGWLENPFVKFVLFPLVPTLPVFRLHQYITYGGTFGEYYTFGLAAYLLAFAIWWASWCMNMVYVAAVLRVIVEAVSIAAAGVLPRFAAGIRGGLEVLQRVVYYLGVPAWLILRLTA